MGYPITRSKIVPLILIDKHTTNAIMHWTPDLILLYLEGEKIASP